MLVLEGADIAMDASREVEEAGPPKQLTVSSLMDSLPFDARCLVRSALQCEGPQVPGVVVSLFHRAVSSDCYKHWEDYVESNGFVEFLNYEVPWGTSVKKIWSIANLKRTPSQMFADTRFSSRLLVDHPHALDSAFLRCADYKCNTDYLLLASLCFAYGAKWLSEEAAVKLTIMSRAQDRELLRLAIEPVLWLLQIDNEIEEEWEEKRYWSARMVVIKYIIEGKLDDEAAATLLSRPETAPPMCKMMQLIGGTQQTFVLDSGTPLIMNELLKLLERDRDQSFGLQRWAAETLASFAPTSCNFILQNSCLLPRLQRLLHKDVKHRGQAGAALALGKLASTDDSRHKIAAYPRLLAKLTDLMGQSRNIGVQENAAFAIAQLSEKFASRTVIYSRTVKKLLPLLGKEIVNTVQTQAAKALANMACVEKLARRIAKYSGVIAGVGQLLEEGTCSNVQFQVSRLLVHLSSVEVNHSYILKEPGLLKAVVAQLATTSCVSTEVHENLTKVLANLCATKKGKAAIVGVPNAVKYLLVLAADTGHLETQKNATTCLEYVGAAAAENDRQAQMPSSSTSGSKVVLGPEVRIKLAEWLALNPKGSRRQDLAKGERRWTIVRIVIDQLRFRFKVQPKSGETKKRKGITHANAQLNANKPVIEVQLAAQPKLSRNFSLSDRLEGPLRVYDGSVGKESRIDGPFDKKGMVDA